MATHLIFDNQGTPHLATETENGFLTNSGIFANSNIRFACPVGELEKRVMRFGAWDKVYNRRLGLIEEVSKVCEYPTKTSSDTFTEYGKLHNLQYTPTLMHLSEARRLGLIPRTDDTETTD